MIGGFFDRYGETWSEAEIDWYEALLERLTPTFELAVDVMLAGWKQIKKKKG